jgi:hypothetical protein
MDDKKDEVIKKLTKKYYLKITTECVELSPKIEECFEIRDTIIAKLYGLTGKRIKEVN